MHTLDQAENLRSLFLSTSGHPKTREIPFENLNYPL